MNKTDNIFATAQEEVKDFVFDDNVAEVFPDMIKRSVPGYQTMISTIGHLAHEYAQDNSQIYDLGCSLGAATLSIRRKLTAKNCTIIAVDNSQAMVNRCQQHLNNYKSEIKTQVLCDDIMNIDIQDASIVVLNFTLQFISPSQRDTLIKNIYQGMKPGGILIISEKLVFEQANIQSVIDELHLDFKRAQGYSELEISQKRASIENVLIPDTLEQHYKRFEQAGFDKMSQWYQCFNFSSLIAIK